LTLVRAYDQAIRILGWLLSWGLIHFEERGMMSISRIVALAVAAASFSVVPAVDSAAQNVRQNRQERRPGHEQKDIDALLQMVDAVNEGKQPAPTDVPVAWESNHFVKGSGGTTYIPFTLAIDPKALGMPAAAVYVRVMDKGTPQLSAAEQAFRARDTAGRQRGANQVTYPWANIHFVDLPQDGKVSRAMALQPGAYEVIIAVKDRTQEKARNQPPAKLGYLKRDLTVPDFNLAELSTSSVIVASAIESLSSPLKEEEQQENPYTFGTMKVVPSADRKLKKSGELQVLFWVYGVQETSGKPDVTIEYNFHQKTAEGEKYFNKTAPQALNASTLPPQFSVAAGHQLPGSLVVPLTSFPEGEYRLEIKVTDKVSGKTLTQNAAFVVEA
jgi:hypothetical protein